MKTIILSVYFSGTAHELRDGSQLASLLNSATLTDNETIFKMSFDGCGITNGLMGSLFGTGLEAQCDEVVNFVTLNLLQGRKVHINAYGHSRGGIAALMLAKRLGQFSHDLLETNLCLMDPVPGNFIWTSTIDFTHRSLARQTMKLSNCKNLKNVFVLYPNEPLASVYAHAPLLCEYPESCNVVEEIMPGCHAGAQFTTQKSEFQYRKIAFVRCYQFLEKLGTVFNSRLLSLFNHKVLNSNELLDVYKTEFNNAKTAGKETTRSSHAKRSTKILARPENAEFLSAQHADLHFQLNPDESKQRTPLYVFSRPRPQHVFKPINPMGALNIQSLFECALNNMSMENKVGIKGSRVKSLMAECASVTDENIHNYFRNGLALFLQRDNQLIGLFSRTSSGKALVNLLNTYPQYATIKQTILGAEKDRPIRYEDLRCYVIGRNDKKFFAEKNAQTLFAQFKDKEGLLQNKMLHFLSC